MAVQVLLGGMVGHPQVVRVVQVLQAAFLARLLLMLVVVAVVIQVVLLPQVRGVLAVAVQAAHNILADRRVLLIVVAVAVAVRHPEEVVEMVGQACLLFLMLALNVAQVAQLRL